MKKLTTLILFTLIGTFLSSAQETPAPAKTKKPAVTKVAAPTNAQLKQKSSNLLTGFCWSQS